jgi:ribosomal protein L11 methyltransferase
MSTQPVFEYHSQSVKVPLELPNGNKQMIQIESGYAFGTGNHFTTKLCLQMIENIFKYRVFENVLDVGCGSGILAICAIALGADCATAIDIEPSVIGEAKKNVYTNGFSSRIQVHNKKIDNIIDNYDLVIANILTDQIVSISDKLVSRLNNNGLLILSGIRKEEQHIIIEEFSTLGTQIKKILTVDDWCALLFYKD